MTKRSLKLMPDYGCWPLWTTGSEAKNIDPRSLPLLEETTRKLETWAKAYDDTLDQDYPPNSKFRSEEDHIKFNLLGRELLQKLRNELGNKFDVIYHNHYDKEFSEE